MGGRFRTATPTAPKFRRRPAETGYPDVFDFYQAKSDKPTPVVIYIHGGGWVQGDKRPIDPRGWLAKGISFVSLNYRFTTDADAEGIGRRWNGRCAMRRERCNSSAARRPSGISTSPGSGRPAVSAGACSSLWLAFHADMADPQQRPGGPRIDAAVVRGGRRRADFAGPATDAGMDSEQQLRRARLRLQGRPREETTQFQEFLAGREKVLPWIKEYSPYELVCPRRSPDLPLLYDAAGDRAGGERPDALGQFRREVAGTLQIHWRPLRTCLPGAPDVKHATVEDFIIAMLKTPQTNGGL